MMNNPSPSNRSGTTSSTAREFTPARREAARRSGPADQLMYAWSISAARGTTPEKHTVVRSHEDCPPEVYLG